MDTGTRPEAVFIVRRTFRYSAASTSHSARMTMNDTATSSKCHRASHSTLRAQLAMNRMDVMVKRSARTGAVRVYATSHTTIAT